MQKADLEPLKSPLSLEMLLRRPEINYNIMKEMFDLPEIPAEIRTETETSIKYGGYIKKQSEQIARMERMENKLLPQDLDYYSA